MVVSIENIRRSIRQQSDSILDRVRLQYRRFRLREHSFTIVSNNCWGAEVYRDFALPYATPFVGLFICPDCYIRLLQSFEHLMRMDLVFIEKSKYEWVNELRSRVEIGRYPLALLGGEVEIHFQHYTGEKEALEKWNRRKARINWKYLCIEFSQRDKWTPTHLAAFSELNYIRKVCFTAQSFADYPCSIWIKECENQLEVMDGKLLYPASKKYFNLMAWINLK